MVSGGDWPQILGPHRNGLAADDESLADSWARDGPTELWKIEVGDGLAGPAVMDGTVYVFHRQGNSEILQALALSTGSIRWEYDQPTTYRSSYTSDSGPRCVPVVHEDHVYVFGAGGQLSCVARGTGEEIWSRNVWADFQPPEGYFGAGSSPIVIGDRVVLNVGATKAGIVAFDARTGDTEWQLTDELASYSSPVRVDSGSDTFVIFITRFNVVVIDPESGTELSRLSFGQRGPTVNAANPLVFDNRVLVTASYGIGARLLSIDSQGQLDEVWSRTDLVSSQYVTPILHDDIVFSMDGRADGGATRLVVFEPKTGRELWVRDDYGMASMIHADDKLLLMKTDGELVLVRANRQRYEELARHKIMEGTTRALAALADGRLLVRNSRQLKCVDLR